MKEPERPEDAGGANYRLSVDLFNGREVPTGLLNVRVELFSSDSGAGEDEPFVSIPQDLSTTRRGKDYPGLGEVGGGIDDLKMINLPPRQIVHIELKGTFGKEAAVALAAQEWSRVDFVGELPAKPFYGILGNKTYRKTITEP